MLVAVSQVVALLAVVGLNAGTSAPRVNVHHLTPLRPLASIIRIVPEEAPGQGSRKRTTGRARPKPPRGPKDPRDQRDVAKRARDLLSHATPSVRDAVNSELVAAGIPSFTAWPLDQGRLETGQPGAMVCERAAPRRRR